jgi:Ni/Co efflux regulator RcnB
MKKLFIIVVLFAGFAAGCLTPTRAEASTNPRSQARADRKMQKKQQKAMKKYMKAQKKAQNKMIKKDRKNTHLPSHY